MTIYNYQITAEEAAQVVEAALSIPLNSPAADFDTVFQNYTVIALASGSTVNTLSHPTAGIGVKSTATSDTLNTHVINLLIDSENPIHAATLNNFTVAANKWVGSLTNLYFRYVIVD